jgi:hypothetical protein
MTWGGVRNSSTPGRERFFAGEEAIMPERNPYQTVPPRNVAYPPPTKKTSFGPAALAAILLGALLGALFGTLAGNVSQTVQIGGHFGPFGEMSWTLFGLLAGLGFVLIGLLLYPLIRNALSGAVVLGLFAMLAMALVGGIFGAIIGLLAGAFLGALVGAAKAQGGLVVGDVSFPRRGAPASPPMKTLNEGGRDQGRSRVRKTLG